ncbi:hypothetical protein IIH27_001742 [Campylobacter jejuni]|nr:hypothetical protein [Campylobacter jejuni]EHM2403072.1 hypothetical protein [Campylobacter jejuni]EIK8597174.1 hypothetical protein [Campylobacter jejuni]ELM7269877.1 hypothetical protein [Campylobacter jejuni]
MNLLNKKFILVYAIYIGIIALIYFFGKDFLLVFDKSFLEKRGIKGVLVYLLTVIPLLFLFFYYSNAKLSVDYLKSEAMFIIFLILLSSLIAPVAIYEMFREKEEVEG